jgi:hypothetical protein
MESMLSLLIYLIFLAIVLYVVWIIVAKFIVDTTLRGLVLLLIGLAALWLIFREVGFHLL